MPEDYYSLLGVDEDATEEAILEAYRRKAAEHHPDVSDEPGADETFRRLNRAKQVLTDADRRRAYDRLGHDRFVEEGPGDDRRDEGSAPRRGPSPAATAEGVGVPPTGPGSVVEAFLGARRGGAAAGGTAPAAVDLESLFAAARAAGRSSARSDARECPRCHGRGTFVHVIDTARGRHRRLEPCERCGGAGTVAS